MTMVASTNDGASATCDADTFVTDDDGAGVTIVLARTPLLTAKEASANSDGASARAALSVDGCTGKTLRRLPAGAATCPMPVAWRRL
jgi:hypothetical protein